MGEEERETRNISIVILREEFFTVCSPLHYWRGDQVDNLWPVTSLSILLVEEGGGKVRRGIGTYVFKGLKFPKFPGSCTLKFKPNNERSMEYFHLYLFLKLLQFLSS